MNKVSKYLFFLAVIVWLAGTTSCFKNSFPKVGPPDDVKGDSVTTAPEWNKIGKKVLLIGVGGCEGAALRLADAPNIKGLLPHAVYSYDALTQPPTSGATGWSSLLTGVWGSKHGVKDNSFSGNNFSQYPAFTKYMKEVNPSYKFVSICSWDPINEFIMNGANVKINIREKDEVTKDSAVVHLKKGDGDFIFVNFDGVDQAGHQYGFDTLSVEYMNAITTVDGYVGALLGAVKNRPSFEKEDWLIIITSDHGGNEQGHGGSSYPEKNIFTLFYNQDFPSKEMVPPQNILKSIYFNNSDQYGHVIDESGFLDFDQYSGFTVQFEVQAPNSLTADDPLLTNKDWNSGGNDGWVVAVDGQKWKFNAGHSGNRIDLYPNAPDLSDGKWHSIAFSVKKEGRLNLYQDDSLYTYTNLKTTNELHWATSSDVKLASGDDITGSYKEKWGLSKFIIANIRVWDTVIDLEDMKKYAKACNTVITPDNPFYKNLVGFWKGNEGSGAIFEDYGPHGLDMQLFGQPQWIEQQLDLCNNQLPPSVPTIVDIAPSVLAWFKIPVDPGWKLDGISQLP